MLILGTTGYGYSKTLCKDVVLWFIRNKLSRFNITIDIIHKGLKRELVYAWCTVEDSTTKPRCFLIEIQSHLNKADYISTLLHELHHVYQHVKGHLKDTPAGVLWKGISYNDYFYDDLPWEVEARKMEKLLYEEYITENTP